MDRSARVVLWRSKLFVPSELLPSTPSFLSSRLFNFQKGWLWSRVSASAFPALPLTGQFMSRVWSREKPFLCKAVLVRSELVLFNLHIRREQESSRRVAPRATRESLRGQERTRFCSQSGT